MDGRAALAHVGELRCLQPHSPPPPTAATQYASVVLESDPGFLMELKTRVHERRAKDARRAARLEVRGVGGRRGRVVGAAGGRLRSMG